MMRRMNQIIMVILLGTLLPYHQGAGQDVAIKDVQVADLKPVFALPGVPASLPLRESLFEMDPSIRGWIDNAGEAVKTEHQINALMATLSPKSGKNDRSKLEQIYMSASRLVVFYNDTQKSSSLIAVTREAKKKQFAGLVLGVGEKLVAVSQGESRANIIYQMHYVKVLMKPSSFDTEVSDMLKIKEELSPKLKKSLELMLAVTFTESTMTYNEGMTALTSNMNDLRTIAQVAANLCLARALVGVNQAGERVTPAVNPAYAKNVETALRLAAILPAAIRNDVLAYAIWLWQQAQGQGAKDQMTNGTTMWAKFDFDLSYYRDTVAGTAAREWSLLGKYYPADLPTLITGYKKLQGDIRDAGNKVKLDRQMLFLQKSLYAKSGGHAVYAAALAELAGTYGGKSPAGVSPKVWSAFARQVAVEEQNFYLQLLALAGKADTPANARQGVASEALSYLARAHLTAEQTVAVKEALAKFYFQTQAYQQAADIYRELAAKNAPHYMPLVILSLSKLVGWPIDPDFKLAAPSAQKPAYAALINAYSAYVKTMGKKCDPSVVVDLGILKINQGQETAGSADLQSAIELAPNSKVAGNAAGWLLVHYMARPDYQRVIDIAGLVAANKVAPVDPATGKLFPLDTKLPLALLAAAKAKAGKGDYIGAIKHLVVLVNVYQHATEHEEGSYLLAQYLYAAGQRPTAVKVLVDYCNKYPNAKGMDNTLLSGAGWAAQANLPDQVIYFYSHYLTAFKDSPRVPKIRNDLAQTYIARTHYFEAMRQYKDQMEDRKTSPEEKIAAAIAYLNTQEQYGEMQEGIWCANKLLTLAGRTNVRAAMAAYAYQAHNAFKNDDFKTMAELEKSIVKWDINQPDVNEALGFVRFYVVNHTVKAVTPEENPKMLADPKKAIIRINDQFLALRKQYETVCPKMIHRYCGPMHFELANHAQIARKAISEIELAASLGEADVKAFNLFREQYIQQLNAFADSSLAQAASLAKQDKVDARWKSKILYVADRAVAH